MTAYGLEPDPPRLARGMWKRFAGAMVLLVLLTAGASATTVLLQVDTSIKTFIGAGAHVPLPPGVLTDVDAGQPQTILLLGSDRRYQDKKDGKPARSDTIILVRLDPSNNATAILNIPRDLKVTYHHRDGTPYFDKINAAYEKGGPAGTVRKVKELMTGIDGRSFDVNHVVSVNFGAFRKAVDRLGCFYIDVDRRYFNDNMPPYQSPTNYATIDLKPGYQRLCGSRSLDYVRFRHLDTDIVRGARQQAYLSQAKDQLGVARLFRDRDKLLRIFGRYTQTDIASTKSVLRLLKLAYESSRNPLRRIRFPAIIGPSYVTTTRAGLERMKRQFLQVSSSPGPKGTTPLRPGRPKRRTRPSGPAPGLEPAPQVVDDKGVLAAPRLPFPTYVPRYVQTGGQLADGYHEEDVMRPYTLRDESGAKHHAYRMTFAAKGYGDYYGVEGTDWMDPPIVGSPQETRTVNGRELMLFRDGTQLRLVAWRTPKAVYWVSNTLLRTLSNRQMLGLASTLTRAGRSG